MMTMANARKHQQPQVVDGLDFADDDLAESLERAWADLEMVMAAYPDETVILLPWSQSTNDDDDTTATAITARTTSSSQPRPQPHCFPLQFRLYLSRPSCYFDLIMNAGYPKLCNIEIASFRCDGNVANKERMKAAATAIRNAACECRLEEDGGGTEGGLACCAAAMEAWASFTNNAETADDEEEDDDNGNIIAQQPQDQHHHERQVDHHQRHEPSKQFNNNDKPLPQSQSQMSSIITWITGQPLVDRKSTFLAHACQVASESDVNTAIQQLLTSHSKYRRATHNMYAYRLLESLPTRHAAQECNDRGTVDDNNNNSRDVAATANVVVVKHDNDDDGEDGAGSRLAHLLELRHEGNILVLVSRWYGGIQLGPKRFVHISNVARQVLEQFHAVAAATTSSAP